MDEESFDWPTIEESESHSLCTRCSGLKLDKERFHYSLTEQQRKEYGVNFFNHHQSDRLVIARDRIAKLRNTSYCRLCQLILSALQEQYDFSNKAVDHSHEYLLAWRYVRFTFKRYEENDDRYIRYIEILSSANCNHEDLRQGKIMINDMSDDERTSVRSLIAPTIDKTTDGQFLRAKRLGDQIDFKLVQDWMLLCENFHDETVHESTNDTTDNQKHLPSASFMVVNVETLQLISPARPCRYAALSYVWGQRGENSFFTTSMNVVSLQEAKGVAHVWERLPSTIQDAIVLLKRLGERYLWVDSLCIIQDDSKSKHENIKSMKQVYWDAAFTIIAASGEHADCGLPGVRPGTRSRKQLLCGLKPCKDLALIPDVEAAMQISPWVKRGWTLQEWILSRKCLIFIGGLTVFSCHHATWREDVVSEPQVQVIHDDGAPSSLKQRITKITKKPFHRFLPRRYKSVKACILEYGDEQLSYPETLQPVTTTLDEARAHNSKIARAQLLPLNNRDFSYVAVGYELRYTRRAGLSYNLKGGDGVVLMLIIRAYLERNLSDERDILNAFQGVLDLFASYYNTTSIMGNLARFLDLAVSLETYGERREYFPSWSWCGWTGQPQWMSESNLIDWTDKYCWIIWHYRGQEPESIVRVERNVTYEWDREDEEISELLRDSDTEDWNKLDFPYLVLWRIFKYGLITDATPTRLPDGPLCNPEIAKEKGFLQFWTIVLPLKYELAEDGRQVSFYDCDNVKCGEVLLRRAMLMPHTPGICEVIVVSEITAMRFIGHHSYVENRGRKTQRDPCRRIADGMLGILLIAWKHGIAEVLGQGIVWKETVSYLDEPGMQWKEIVLG